MNVSKETMESVKSFAIAALVIGLVIGISVPCSVSFHNTNLERKVNSWRFYAAEHDLQIEYERLWNASGWWLHLNYMSDFLLLARERAANQTIYIFLRSDFLTTTHVDFWFYDKELDFVFVCEDAQN